MSMTKTRALFTRADYDRLPEGFPAELLQGSLVREPAPFYQHQRVAFRIGRLIADRIGDERVVCSPIDVYLDDLNVLQPDVAVFSQPLPAGLRHVPIPTLVIEVLSDSTARRDRVAKSRIYLEHGIAEVWLVHPVDGTIEVVTPAGRTRHAASETVASAAVSEIALIGADLVR